MPDLIFTMNRNTPCRAEAFLRQDCGLSHRQLTRLKHIPGGITREGELVRSIDTVYPGDVLVLHTEDAENEIEPNPALHVPAVFEDDDVIFFDKPAGMPVHPSLSHHGDTLGNACAAQYPGMTFRAVYRLDSNTSGLVAVAKHAPAASLLPGRIEKRYYALLGGDPPEEGTVDAPLGRLIDSLIVRHVTPDGKHAVTHFRILSRGRYALAELRLETGRTHQIRVHMAYIGHPLYGDDVYGKAVKGTQGQCLHARKIGFIHPTTGEYLEFEREAPEYFQKLLLKMES